MISSLCAAKYVSDMKQIPKHTITPEIPPRKTLDFVSNFVFTSQR